MSYGLFLDANLEAAVRQAVANPEGDITIQDLEGLTELVAEDRGIEDLRGLEHATDLQTLRLSCGNQISDLTPLMGLTNLLGLDLGGNLISGLAPLSGLTNLRGLDLYLNQISELTPISGLTHLEWLGLWHNEISDLVPLSGLTHLESLFLRDNQISDAGPLVENQGLGEEDMVNLEANPLSEESLNIHIPQLQARGVSVVYDAPP